ncbi:MAG: hypothetical protein HZB26_04395 [Candidatus Hydrogenedentes bacterium]|nr:hypothetical protein [Candidatus Hydrogenedentota bacterium]
MSACMLLFAPAFALGAPLPNPDYPRVDPAPWYEVDARWPHKPPEFEWAAVSGVTIDREGNVWMYTRSAPSIQVYAPDGNYIFGWGDTKGAHHLKIDREGNVWTSDYLSNVIQKRRRDGTVLLTLGTEGEAGADERHLFKPTDMAFASNGDVFVTDGYGNSRVVHFTKDGKFVNAWGSLGAADGQFSIPHAIVIDSKDRIYVADRNNGRIQVFDTAGRLFDSWKRLIVPWGLWLTDKDEIWVCGSSPMHWVEPGAMLGCPPKDQVVAKFNTDGKMLELHTFPKAADGQEKPGELNWVHCIAVDPQGNLFLGDINGKRLQKFVRHQ